MKNMCMHCGEEEATFCDLWCEACAEKIGEEYMQEFTRADEEANLANAAYYDQVAQEAQA